MIVQCAGVHHSLAYVHTLVQYVCLHFVDIKVHMCICTFLCDTLCFQEDQIQKKVSSKSDAGIHTKSIQGIQKYVLN